MSNDLALYYREPWMSDDQWECALMFADLMRGFHHIGGTFKPSGSGITINEPYGAWATYDFDGLTRAVFMAHDRCIRIDITTSSPGRLKFLLHKRHKREGAMHERHPTLAVAVDHWRKRNPPTEEAKAEA